MTSGCRCRRSSCPSRLPLTGPEEWPVKIILVFCFFQILPDALRGLGVNGQTALLATFAHYPQ